MFIALLALPMVAHAQEGEKEVVVKENVEAVNNGDAVKAQETISEGATVTVPEVTTSGTESEGEGETETEAGAAAVPTTTYTGEEIEVWLEGQANANANIEMNAEACTVAGDVVTCNAAYKSDALAAQGIASMSGTLEAVVVEGKIQSWDFIPSAESVAQIQAMQAPQTLPVSGGTPQATTNMMLVALGLLLLLAGAATYAFQRRGV